MSTLKVEICKIEEVQKHPNADRLDVIRVKGWWLVSGKGNFKPGDLCVYLPIDSVLPKELEDKLFPPDTKIKLSKSRIRTIKIRGYVSQGMAVKLDILPKGKYSEGQDVTSILGVTKYEPPAQLPSAYGKGLNQTKKKFCNGNFHKYTDIENIKNYPDIFADKEIVYVSEKLHGTSFRCGWFPTEANTLWKKIKKYLGLLPKYEFCYGSRNVQLQDQGYNKKTGFYPVNVYAKIVNQYNLKETLEQGQALYGEIVGDGIQDGYLYGCNPGEHKLFAYDIKENGEYVDYLRFITVCGKKGIPVVPDLYVGPYDYDLLKGLTVGPSVVTPTQKIREGIVIKGICESSHPRLGRKILKFISDDYLQEDNSDFH